MGLKKVLEYVGDGRRGHLSARSRGLHLARLGQLAWVRLAAAAVLILLGAIVASRTSALVALAGPVLVLGLLVAQETLKRADERRVLYQL